MASALPLSHRGHEISGLNRIAGLIAIAIWLAGCVAFLIVSVRFDFRAGARGAAASHWDYSDTLGDIVGSHIAVMGVHPKCPCTVASIAELIRIHEGLTHHQERFVVLAYVPKGVSSSQWDLSSLRAQAEAAGIEVREDPDGNIAAQLGMKTSGHVVCYDAQGQLRFSGGITVSRGHVGRNSNSDALLSVLRQVKSNGPAGETAVFGCEIQGNVAPANE